MIDKIDDEIFEDLKACAIKVWEKYDDTYGYRSDKISRVERISNFADNYIAFIQMFDVTNQKELFTRVQPSTAMFLRAYYINYYSEAAKYDELYR